MTVRRTRAPTGSSWRSSAPARRQPRPGTPWCAPTCSRRASPPTCPRPPGTTSRTPALPRHSTRARSASSPLKARPRPTWVPSVSAPRVPRPPQPSGAEATATTTTPGTWPSLSLLK
ncbi:hypothetical protein BS78_K268400 [Paspalum vaginatum]|uniref:Uncharacterized protein n=1 Tax=Paspalum vaginatum TaxID=158149 RepID=A0A9W8CF11_9POAL|nr:hypothetical protein BS78_K268400 [Paspalum vaginatum]